MSIERRGEAEGGRSKGWRNGELSHILHHFLPFLSEDSHFALQTFVLCSNTDDLVAKLVDDRISHRNFLLQIRNVFYARLVNPIRTNRERKTNPFFDDGSFSQKSYSSTAVSPSIRAPCTSQDPACPPTREQA